MLNSVDVEDAEYDLEVYYADASNVYGNEVIYNTLITDINFYRMKMPISIHHIQ